MELIFQKIFTLNVHIDLQLWFNNLEKSNTNKGIFFYNKKKINLSGTILIHIFSVT